jgi:DUF1016 N-terminal domain
MYSISHSPFRPCHGVGSGGWARGGPGGRHSASPRPFLASQQTFPTDTLERRACTAKRCPRPLAFGLVHSEPAAQASRAVNVSLTLRNWLIGSYIAEYELLGKDRANYGEKLLDSLATELSVLNVSNSNRRQLYRYLRFYRTYPA